MARFILHGTVLEEPSRRTVGKGLDVVTLKIEERYSTAFKEQVNRYDVNFVGKSTKCIPTDIKLAGAPVVVVGVITSRQFKDNLYYDIKGEELTIITLGSFKDKASRVAPVKQEEVEEVRDKSISNDNVAEDDLPF